MVVEARIRVRHRGCWTERLTGSAHVTLVGGDRSQVMAVMHGETPEAVDAFIATRLGDADHPVIVDRSPLSVVLRCEPPDSGIIATTAALGCTILWPAVYTRGTELYTILAPDRPRIEALVDRLSELGDVHVERVSEVGADEMDVTVPLSDLTSSLSARQLAVIRRAIEHGYYDSPRRTSAEMLGRSFGVSRSTLQEHLRKAERRLLEGLASTLALHPELEDAAKRRPGRPRRAPPRAPRVLRPSVTT